MNKELYATWLFADNFGLAAKALLSEGYKPLLDLESKRTVDTPQSMMLLQYAFDQVDNLAEIKDVGDINNVTTAFWYLIREVTRGDLLLENGEYPQDNDIKIKQSTKKLYQYNKGKKNRILIDAAHEFYYNRHEYVNGPTFMRRK